MAQFSRTSTTDWQGTLMEGKGTAKAGTGAFSLPVTFPQRIGEPDGATSPEELISAAHAACFAMVIAATMGKKSATVAEHSVKCTVTADKSDAGIKIITSKLEVTAEGVSGMDKDTFMATVKDAEKGCPVSNALRNRSRSRLWSTSRRRSGSRVPAGWCACRIRTLIDRWCAWLRGPRAGRSTQRRIEVALDPDGHL